jgi:rubrerythrin
MDHTGDRPTATRPTGRSWVHVCERCGEQMEERHCKIVCPNCGHLRDCSDP